MALTGGPGVILISGPSGRAIAKYPVRQEAAFYRSWAPLVRQHGLGVPEVYAQGENSTRAWILMEALDATLTPPYRDRLPDMAAYLAQLHAMQRDRVRSTADPLSVRPVALSLQDIDDAAALWTEEVREYLVHLLHLSWPALPTEMRLVSGDPNPTNWGVRASGQLVLFDWSEVAWSHPAYDLAVLCGGLPEVALVEEVVDVYLESADAPSPQSRAQWVAWVITARLVAFVWFAAWWSRGQLTEAARPGLTMLQDGLIDWIDTVRSATTAFLP
ncbi:phosphotransferase [Sulfobacillus harzensis]|uniref:phosphotransferase n=1 Tax=Sulfobacillus harzensis TaxID=2729629 RepID=UPI001A9B3E77|nr:phosphotransferase [Sulfobacillus harzensis]